MSVTFIRGDITKLEVDAIVNAANNELRGGGGVDGAIHAAAGAEQLHAFCKTLGGCPTGEAKLSPGFNLPAKYIIHTVGPVWQGGGFHEKTLLTSCYIRSLELARENHCKSVAFPLISAGAYGYPYNDALQIAYDTCRRFLTETKADMEIYIRQTWKSILCCICANAVTTLTSGSAGIIPGSPMRLLSGA